MAVKKLPNGKYVADFRDAQRNRFRPQFDTRKEADAALNEAKQRIRKGEFLAPRSVPNFEQCAREWLASRADRRAAVIDNYSRHVNLYLVPKFGVFKVNCLDAQMIEQFRAELCSHLAVTTVRSVMNTVSQVFKFAVRQRHIMNNPMASVERFHAAAAELTGDTESADDGDSRQVRPQDVLDACEIRRLIAASRPGLHRTLVATAAATGARFGELTALRWSDVDLETGRITIERSLSWARGSESTARYRFYPPKTRAGIRTIPIQHDLTMLLKVWKLACPKGELDLVFPAPDGRPLRRSSSYLRGFAPALKAAGLRAVKFHSLRHSYCSAMIAAGAPVTEIAELVGHANPSITLKIYSHWFKGAVSGAGDRVAAALLGHQVDSNGQRDEKSA
jgi:integrase